MDKRVLVCPLRSGSSGNAVLISDRHTNILIDAGVSCCTVEKALASLGQSADSLTALLVTHEHSDHVLGIGVLMRRYGLPLFVNLPTWQAMQGSIGLVDPSLVNIIDRTGSFSIGSFAISSFATPHDAVASAGFRLETDSGTVSLMTDIGEVTPSLLEQVSGSQAVLIEANYDPAMLMAGPYPALLKQRVNSPVGHLSNEACAHAVAALLQQGTEHFILSHLSKDNNFPELAMLTVGRHLNAINAQVGEDVMISVARRFAVSDPVWL